MATARDSPVVFLPKRQQGHDTGKIAARLLRPAGRSKTLGSSQHASVSFGVEAAEQLRLGRLRDGSERLRISHGTVAVVGSEADLRIAGTMAIGEVGKPIVRSV